MGNWRQRTNTKVGDTTTMAFKKPKPTFNSTMGRRGTPTAVKPQLSSEDKAELKQGAYKTAKKTTRKPLKGTAKVVPNGKPQKTTKLKGALNSYRTAKATKLPKRAKFDKAKNNFGMSKKPTSLKQHDKLDQRIGNYFSGIAPAGIY